MQPPPHILLLFTDQQRWDAMGAYGNPVIHTPNMDRLAQEGVLFENAITPCPICVPARACAMTGQAAGKIGILDNNAMFSDASAQSQYDRRDTIPVLLSKNGYFTQAIGKMHFTPDGESYGFDNMVLSEEMRSTRFAKSAEEQWFDDYDKFLIDNAMWGW